MKLNTPLKIVTGICSTVPLIYLFALIVPFALGKISHFDVIAVNYEFIMSVIYLMVPFLLFTYGTMIFLMVHAFKNIRFTDNRKLFWALVLFFLNILSFPAYWYLHILKNGRKDFGEKSSAQNFATTILFFIPLALVILIIVISALLAGSGRKLDQPWIMLWAVFFDVTFFPLLIYLFVKILKNKEFSAGKKVLWICMLLLFNMIVFPVYQHKYLNAGKPSSSQPS